jgi:hypothetical protein
MTEIKCKQKHRAATMRAQGSTLILVAACVFCSLAPASAFSTSTMPWMRLLSSRQNQVCGSLSRRGPHQVVKGPIAALSMSLDPQLLKNGIAAYGIIIGAGGIVAGISIFRSCSVFGGPGRQRLRISYFLSQPSGIKAGSKPSIISSTLASILLAIAYKVINVACKTLIHGRSSRNEIV